MSKVLVTGADGFVGQTLIPQLWAAGYAVTEVSRRGDKGRVAIGDIGQFDSWSPLLAGVDVVVHLAARAHVMRETTADPLAEFRRVNVAGTLTLATAAARAGVRHFVFLSSIGVNGSRSGAHAFSESDVPAPTDAYAVSKWEAEQGLLDIASTSSMSITRLRPPLIVGPGVKGNLRRLMELVHRGFPLPFGSIRNRRSFVALPDLCDLLTACASDERARGELFLVADPNEISTPDLLRSIASAFGHPARVVSVPLPVLRLLARMAGSEAELQRLAGSLRVCASRAHQTLGWTPRVGLQGAICAMVAAYLRETQS